MALESTTYINGLDPANPPSSDPVGQGDDHIRLIKQTLKSTFPNITGPVTANQGQLNNSIPIGAIIVWYGSLAAIPSGWALCNGSAYSRTDGGGTIYAPNLIGRTVLGADSDAGSWPVNRYAGGTAAYTTMAGAQSLGGVTMRNGAHDHGGSTRDAYLTTDQIPSHNHFSANFGTSGGMIRIDGNSYDPNYQDRYILQGGGDEGGGYSTGHVGGGAPHSHPLGLDGEHVHTFESSIVDHRHAISDFYPPHVVLCYIMKI